MLRTGAIDARVTSLSTRLKLDDQTLESCTSLALSRSRRSWNDRATSDHVTRSLRPARNAETRHACRTRRKGTHVHAYGEAQTRARRGWGVARKKDGGRPRSKRERERERERAMRRGTARQTHLTDVAPHYYFADTDDSILVRCCCTAAHGATATVRFLFLSESLGIRDG